jgi:putative amide transporter protein
MVGVVLLYVGVVLIVNGIWLIGQARAAAIASRTPAMESAAVGTAVRGGGGYAGEAAAGQELGGEPVVAPPPRGAEAHPLFIQNREVAILNIFTGFIGVAIAVTYIVLGGTARLPALGLLNIQTGGAILLFAFTYLWVAYNQYANAGGRALGWYSLFVAVTAVYAGINVVQNTPGNNTADLWLAGNWFAWAVLWAMFWALLSLELPIARITGWVAILEGFGTAWALALALLWGKLAFA